jgi:hypothetical protein
MRTLARTYAIEQREVQEMPCRVIRRQEARRALYVDFEGRVDRPPALLGVATGDTDTRAARQVLVDERFRPALGDLDLGTIEEAVREVVVRAEREDRLLVAWSHHEERVVRTYVPAPLADRFAVRFRSAIETAEGWRRGLTDAPPLRRGNRLADYLRLIGYEVPPVRGPGWTGDTLRILGDAFDRGLSWEELTGRRRARWTNLLGHNADDVMGLREVCLVATGLSVPRSRRIRVLPAPARAWTSLLSPVQRDEDLLVPVPKGSGGAGNAASVASGERP